ncbi:secreted protein, partial [mine drainage metagenome]
MITRRKRTVLELAVATACFGAAAVTAVMPVTAVAAPQNASAQTTVPQKKTAAHKIANEDLLKPVTINGFVSSIQNSIAIQKNSNSIVEAISAQNIGRLPASSIAVGPAATPRRLRA